MLPAAWVIPLPKNYPLVKGAQFSNIISACDILEMSSLESGQWLALSAGNSTVAAIVLQFARRKGIRTLAIVRRARSDFDLRSIGAEVVLETHTLEKDLHETVRDITEGRSIDSIIDCVGGPNLAHLIRCASRGAQVIIYGGFSSEQFSLHNFDLLLKVLDIRSYAYRYFFDPPAPEDLPQLWALAEQTAGEDFKVPEGGLYSLDDFRLAVQGTLERPEQGKRFFAMSDG